MRMNRSLLRQEVLPFLTLLGLLVGAAWFLEWTLERLDPLQVGRYLGIPGAVLILASFAYSLRKRKLIRAGDLRRLLALHETMTWTGCLLVLVHAGTHFTSVLPWLALGAMLVNVISGLTGKLLLDRSRRQVAAMREKFQLRGMPRAEVERAVFEDAVALDLMARWRSVHFPISLAFGGLALGHIVTVLLFWGGR